MKKLPIGIQDFGKLREGNFLYVDKTEYIYRLMDVGNYVFFSRPRRFGKSLTVSTLNEIFTGNKALFQGLWIEDKIDWQPRPVIRLDMNNLSYKERPFAEVLAERMDFIGESYGISLAHRPSARDKFSFLLETFSAQGRKAAILIDEYDKPITDYLDDQEQLKNILPVLKQFYGVLKSLDAHIYFAFITGVSKFGKVSIFSDLNNLNDMTMDKGVLALCGYTQPELEGHFSEHIDAAATEMNISRERVLAGIKHWYNGYTWDGNAENSVYNPFSLLNFFAKPFFRGYWFETGTPTMLTKLLRKEQMASFELENLDTDEIGIAATEIHDISAVSLLFQTGYLTIHERHADEYGTSYILGYPNEEVRVAFNKYVLGEYLEQPTNSLGSSVVRPICVALENQDWESFFEQVQTLFASIPYNITVKKEAYFHSIMHIVLTVTGWRVFSEVATNRGRMDTVLENRTTVYIFEFKIGESADAALAQTRNMGYPERYAKSGKKLVLIGVSYDLEARNVREWKVETPTSSPA